MTGRARRATSRSRSERRLSLGAYPPPLSPYYRPGTPRNFAFKEMSVAEMLARAVGDAHAHAAILARGGGGKGGGKGKGGVPKPSSNSSGGGGGAGDDGTSGACDDSGNVCDAHNGHGNGSDAAPAPAAGRSEHLYMRSTGPDRKRPASIRDDATLGPLGGDVAEPTLWARSDEHSSIMRVASGGMRVW